MGSRFSKSDDESCYKTQLKNINEDDLDISAIDRLQIKALKELINDMKEVKEKKSDKIMYRLPVQICNYSLFLVIILLIYNIINQ